MQITLIDKMGTDLTVVNAARVSFDKESLWNVFDDDGNQIEFPQPWEDYRNKQLSEKDQKLISYLAKHNHWTPFSHVQITMREKVPIFVARQRFKHMVGFTYNEVSRRYVDDAPEFYTPDVWRKRAENKKQGSSDEQIFFVEKQIYSELIGEMVNDFSPIHGVYQRFIDNAEELYNDFIKAGVAPEQARMVLPQSMYTEYFVTGSLAAWARAYKLRIDSHAQKEIQDLAVEWNKLIGGISELQHSWKALTE